MIKVKHKYFVILFYAILLSGCSDNGLLLRSFGEYDSSENTGIYYVGEPYRIRGVLYTPQEDMTYSEKGIAGWYTKSDMNRLTTNGEIFDDNLPTAAHKTLPLPSLVRITNLENGNTAIVRVNDRGPNVNNRLVDVSQKVASDLEFRADGTTLVQIDILPDESLRLKKTLKSKAILNAEDNPEIDFVSSEIPLGEEVPVYAPSDEVMPIYEETVLMENLDPLADGEENESVELSDDEDKVFNSVQNEEDLSSAVSDDIESKKSLLENNFEELHYWIQVGAFGKTNYLNKALEIFKDFQDLLQQEKKNDLTIVRIGPFKTQKEAEDTLDKIHQSGYPEAQIRTLK